MSAPTGNQFWKLRSKHGRDTIFESPETMLEACYEYFEHQSKQSWDKTDFKGRDVQEVKIPTSSPFTLTGLCLFLGVNTKYFTEFESNLKTDSNKEHKDFSEVITHVREVIYTQKFEGAVTGAYNANIIARDLGLTDKTDITSAGKEINGKDLSKFTNEELIQYKKLQEKL